MQFEEEFAEWIGAKMAISCTNGTAALHIALASLGIGPGDEVIVPSYSFIASSFAIVQAGAIPVFADVTEEHTIDPDWIEKLITPKTRAIVVVHLYLSLIHIWVDLGFLRLPTVEEFETIFLEEDTLLVVLPENHPMADCNQFPVEALSEYPFMLLEKGAKAEISEIFKRNHIMPNVRFTTWDDYAVMSMVEGCLLYTSRCV